MARLLRLLLPLTLIAPLLVSGCTETCSPANCGGCCDSAGVCQGASEAHCGQGGAACVACGGFEACIAGACRGGTVTGSTGSEGSTGSSTGATSGSSGTTSGSRGSSGGTSSGGTSAGTTGGSFDSPEILTLTASPTPWKQTDPLTFTLIASDPQGAADLAGATLSDPDTGQTYGPFAATGVSGSYTAVTTWLQVDRIRRIDIPAGGGTRMFRIKVLDQGGHTTTRDLPVAVSCGIATYGRCGDTCVDLRSDEANCGRCGTQCTAVGEQCNAGVCACSASNQQVCNSRCTDVRSDDSNCGRCGNACTGDPTCQSGTCRCYQGYPDLCGTDCTNLADDETNCGRCGNRCATGATCTNRACACPSGQMACSGTCIPVAEDEQNCGGCGIKCGRNALCDEGLCSLISVVDIPSTNERPNGVALSDSYAWALTGTDFNFNDRLPDGGYTSHDTLWRAAFDGGFRVDGGITERFWQASSPRTGDNAYGVVATDETALLLRAATPGDPGFIRVTAGAEATFPFPADTYVSGYLFAVDGGAVAVAGLSDGGNDLVRLHSRTGAVTVAVAGIGTPYGLGVKGERGLMARNDGRLFDLNLQSGAQRILGTGFFGGSFAPAFDGQYLWSSSGSDLIRTTEAGTQRTAIVRFGSSISAIVADERHVYVSAAGGVWQVDVQTGVTRSMALGQPTELALSPTHVAWVGSSGFSSVRQIWLLTR